ncbi:TetR/AcrR family transcriptional regulator [Nibrella saemangeumensis]|uniref:TetR/AcrR family transcriptional regulator n=1 Tax=Nibrella saemangeumensis TaxID=1084526 RepID=A0ABP8MEZ5_9BACT
MKEKILTEAEGLFWKYGVKSITMDDIARQLGISKKTIYQHFEDKEDIVFQVVKDKLDRDEEEFQCQFRGAGNPVEEILRVSELLRQHAVTVNPSMVLDVQRHYPKAWAVFLKHKEQYILTSIQDNLRRGVQEGLYRPDIDIEVMARLRIESVQLGFDERVFPGSRANVLAVQEQLLHHFIRGLLTEKGFSVYNQYNLNTL